MTVLAFVFVLGVLCWSRIGPLPDGTVLGVRVLTFAIGFGPKILRFAA